jgi:hypothetical protein
MSKKPSNYAFIDSQSLNLGVRSLGWKLDYQKFRWQIFRGTLFKAGHMNDSVVNRTQQV